MPTGYTAGIADGITFEEFLMTCARAFGALVTMRDAPNDAEIPDKFEPSEYYIKSLNEARERVKYLESLTDQQAEEAARAEYDAELKRQEKIRDENDALKAKYHDMLRNVRGWVPPTKDHYGLKSFMIDQIEKSIKFDCSFVPRVVKPKTAVQWLEENLKTARLDLKYHEKKYKEEVERAEARTAWVKALKDSIK